ncbi:MAG: hypothetical protein Q8P67_13040 [archaeon]|nr:hypothetical protein [archaeon]
MSSEVVGGRRYGKAAQRDKDHLLQSRWTPQATTTTDKADSDKFFAVHMLKRDPESMQAVPEYKIFELPKTPERVGLIVQPKYRRSFAAMTLREQTEQALVDVQRDLDWMQQQERTGPRRQGVGHGPEHAGRLSDEPVDWEAEEEDLHELLADPSAAPEFQRVCGNHQLQEIFAQVKSSVSLEHGLHAVDSLLYMASVSGSSISIRVLDHLLKECERQQAVGGVSEIMERALSDQLSPQISPDFFLRCSRTCRVIGAPLDPCVEALAEVLAESPAVQKPLKPEWVAVVEQLLAMAQDHCQDVALLHRLRQHLSHW